MDLRRQIALVRARLPLIIAAIALAGAAAFGVSLAQTRVYEASTTLIVGQSLSASNVDYNQLLVSQRLSVTYAAVATTRPVLEEVISELGLKIPVTSLLGRVRAETPTDSTLLRVFVQDEDPARAAAIANAVAKRLIDASPAIQGRETQVQAFVDAELAATQEQIQAAETQLKSLNAASTSLIRDAQLQAVEERLDALRSTYGTLLSFSSGTAASLVSVLEPAVAPTDPVSPRPLLNTVLGAVLGLLLALAVAFGADYLDDSVKDPDAIHALAGVSTLGTIARLGGRRTRFELHRLATLLYPRSSAAEAYRTLRTNIEFACVDGPIRTLLVTSAMPGEGKTVTACNLAIVFAQAGRRVLLVDADLRRPGVHAIFGMGNSRGLTTLLRGDSTVDEVLQPTEQENLRVLPTGPLPPNPAELTASQRMRTVVAQLAENADLVVIDSPPLDAVTDSSILSSFVDGTLLVVDAERSHRRAVHSAREALARAGANVLGAVLNRGHLGGDVQYSTYYQAEPAAGEGRVRAPGEPVGPSTG